jgi:hypothetical protein
MSGRLLMNVRLARSPTADVELGRPSKCRECSRASTTLSGIAAMPGIRSEQPSKIMSLIRDGYRHISQSI